MNEEITRFVERADVRCQSLFRQIDAVALANQAKVLRAFQNQRIAQRHFAGTTGYGYDDIGRDTLGRLIAEIFGTEAALASPLLSGGTHAIATALFGVLRGGDCLLSISGEPYDTLMPVIRGEGIGSLAEFGVTYRQVELNGEEFDLTGIAAALGDPAVKVVFVQRSRGYHFRNALSAAKIGEAARFVKRLRPDVCVMVDNCYGEFVEKEEPTDLGADVAIGSFIKNIGGGLSPTGGYIAGGRVWIDRIAGRLTAPGIGAEVGSYAGGYQDFYQGLFMAPHIVAQALKGSCLIGRVMEELGYEALPDADSPMYDIIRSIKFATKAELIAFCQAIQAASPVDSFVTPEPWDMPGYEHQVIMAAGTFVGGASIELSCDAPIKEPYVAYIQGGLTYEHVRLALCACLENMQKAGVLSITNDK